jgi:hypothetical protein
MSPAYGDVALAMKSTAVSTIFGDHFEKMWRKARPLREILPEAKALVEEVCTRLKEVGFDRGDISLYRALAKSGAVAEDVLVNERAKRRVQAQSTLASCDRLIRLGLIHRDTTHRLLMVEHPSKVRASILSKEFKQDSSGRITTRQTRSGKKSYILSNQNRWRNDRQETEEAPEQDTP